MKVNPSSPQGPGRAADAAAERVRDATSRNEAEARALPEAQGATTSDRVDVSTEARALADQSDARPAGGSLSADRLREIGDRLASGYYDRPDVIDEVARRVVEDPDLHSAS